MLPHIDQYGMKPLLSLGNEANRCTQSVGVNNYKGIGFCNLSDTMLELDPRHVIPMFTVAYHTFFLSQQTLNQTKKEFMYRETVEGR